MNEKKNIQDIIDLFAEKEGLNKKEAEAFVKGMFELIEEALATEKYVKVKGLGTFKLTEVNSRESVDINTGERFEIQGHKKITFTPDTTLKDLINKPFAHFETVLLDDVETIEDETSEMTEPYIDTTEELNEVSEIATEEQKQEIEAEMPVETEVVIEETIETDKEDIPTEVVVTEEESPEENTIETEEMENEVTEEPYIIEESEEAHADEESEEAHADEESEETHINEESEEAHINEESEEITEECPMNTEKKERNSWKWTAAIVSIIILILVGTYWFLSKDTEPIENKKPEKKLPPVEKPMIRETPDSIEENATQNAIPPKVETQENKVATIADTLDYQIVGDKTTYTVQSGETLIRIALKFYGSKNYWPYIAIHNKSKLNNNNNLSIGMKLVIPELKPKQQKP